MWYKTVRLKKYFQSYNKNHQILQMSALVSWQWQWAKMVWRPCLMIRWSSQRPKRFQGHGELQGKTLFVLVNFILAGICISVVLNYRALFWWLPGGNNGSLFLRSNKLWEIFQLQLKSQNALRARLRSGPLKVGPAEGQGPLAKIHAVALNSARIHMVTRACWVRIGANQGFA